MSSDFDINKTCLYFTTNHLPNWQRLMSHKKKQEVKDAQVTCVKIATEMKSVIDWNKCPISIFSEIFSPYKHVLAASFRK